MTDSLDDRLDRSSRIVAQIPALLSEDGRYPLDGTLLYAEVDHGYVLPAIFVDRGDRIVYRAPDLHRLADALLALWKVDPPRKRWAEMAYVVQGNRFDVHFIYPEEVDPGEDAEARRARVVARYLGTKRIVYPRGQGRAAGA